MQEELGVKIRIERLLWLVEHFFVSDEEGKTNHDAAPPVWSPESFGLIHQLFIGSPIDIAWLRRILPLLDRYAALWK